MDDSKNAPWGTVETKFDPIHSAARMRDVDTVQQELRSGVDVDILNGRAANGDGGNTALWFAAQGAPTGGLPIVELLIVAGANINRPCEHGRTALHMAAGWGHLDVVRFLVENGADVSLVDENGQTPLELASTSTRVESERLQSVVQYLQQHTV